MLRTSTPISNLLIPLLGQDVVRFTHSLTPHVRKVSRSGALSFTLEHYLRAKLYRNLKNLCITTVSELQDARLSPYLVRRAALPNSLI